MIVMFCWVQYKPNAKVGYYLIHWEGVKSLVLIKVKYQKIHLKLKRKDMEVQLLLTRIDWLIASIKLIHPNLLRRLSKLVHRVLKRTLLFYMVIKFLLIILKCLKR